MHYKPYAHRLRELGFTDRIRKVTVNGGFTCPNLDGSKGRGGCTFCDNRSFSPVAASRGQSIHDQLERGMAHQRQFFKAEKCIAYFQTFSGTYAPVQRLRDLYGQALMHPEVVGLAIGTRPDCVDAQVVDLLQELSRQTFITLELGLQSAHDQTLKTINRAHTFEEFTAAMDLCSGRGFDLCVHIILGLPGETREHWNLTASALKRWKYEGIKIHPLHVVKGTVLEDQYKRGEYRVLDFEDYVQGLVDFLERISPEVGVQRFTGDAMGELLVAPSWCKDKNSVLRAMQSEFERRGTRQGFHWNR